MRIVILPREDFGDGDLAATAGIREFPQKNRTSAASSCAARPADYSGSRQSSPQLPCENAGFSSVFLFFGQTL